MIGLHAWVWIKRIWGSAEILLWGSRSGKYASQQASWAECTLDFLLEMSKGPIGIATWALKVWPQSAKILLLISSPYLLLHHCQTPSGWAPHIPLQALGNLKGISPCSAAMAWDTGNVVHMQPPLLPSSVVYRGLQGGASASSLCSRSFSVVSYSSIVVSCWEGEQSQEWSMWPPWWNSPILFILIIVTYTRVWKLVKTH